MLKTIIVAALLAGLAIPAAAQSRPVPPALQKAALGVLQSRGYTCAQVQDSFIWLSEPGFTLYCPRWKFLFYENGGRWRIEPRQR